MANIILKEKIRNPNPQSQDNWITPFYVTDDNNIHINGFLTYDNAVKTNNIDAKAITGPTLDEENNILVPSKIAENAIIGDIYNNNNEYKYNLDNVKIIGNIANNAIQPRNIGKQAVQQHHIAKKTIQGGGLDLDNDNIADGSILGTKMKDNTITSEKIATNGIKGDYIDENEVFYQGNIAGEAIWARNIKNGAVTKTHLQGDDLDTCISTIENSKEFSGSQKIIFNWKFYDNTKIN